MITWEKIRKLRELILKCSEALLDDDAYYGAELFPVWKVDTQYWDGKDGIHEASRVQDNGILYKCFQSHRSQSDWQPHITPALWGRIPDPAIEWPEWVQPQGAHDAYKLGAKVSHLEKHWISNMEANIFEPGVTGWDEA